MAWWTVFLLTLASLSSFVDRQILSMLTEDIKAHLQISDTAMGMLQGFAFGAFYACAGIPLGWIADRTPRRLLLTTCVGLWSIMTMICGFAGNYVQLFLARMGVGIGEAGLTPSAAPLIRETFPKPLLGRALSLYSLAIPLGGGMATLLGAIILPWVHSLGPVEVLGGVMRPWQVTFLIVGAPGLLIALALLTIRESSRRYAAGPAMSLGSAFKYIGQHRATFVGLIVPGIIAMLLTFGIGFWIPAVFARSWGLSREEVSGFMRLWGLMSIVLGIIGTLSAGALADFMRKKRADGYVIVTMIGVCGLGLSYGLFALMPTPALALGVLALGALAGGIPPAASAAVMMELAPPRMRSLLMALWFLLMGLIGQGLGPVLVPLVTQSVFHDEAALRYAIPIVAFACLAVAAPLLYWVRGPFVRTAAVAESYTG